MDLVDQREDRSPLSSIAGSSSSSSHSIGANSSTSESVILGLRYDSVFDSPPLGNSSSSHSEMENSASSEQMISSIQNSDSLPPVVGSDFIAHHYNVDSMMSLSLDSTSAPTPTVNDENGDRSSEDDNQGNDVEDLNDTNNSDYSSPIIEFEDVEMPLIDQSDALALVGQHSRDGSEPGGLARETMNLISAALRGRHLTPQISSNRMTRPETGQLVKNRSRIDKRHQPLTLKTNTRLKITLRKWNVASTWKWCANDETCGICRMPFEACCIECKTPGDECPLAVGNCRHSFHMHCIVKWTEAQNTARPQCPLCRQEWRFAAG